MIIDNENMIVYFHLFKQSNIVSIGKDRRDMIFHLSDDIREKELKNIIEYIRKFDRNMFMTTGIQVTETRYTSFFGEIRTDISDYKTRILIDYYRFDNRYVNYNKIIRERTVIAGTNGPVPKHNIETDHSIIKKIETSTVLRNIQFNCDNHIWNKAISLYKLNK